MKQLVHVPNDHCLELKLNSLSQAVDSSALFGQFLCLTDEKLNLLVLLILEIQRNDEHSL